MAGRQERSAPTGCGRRSNRSRLLSLPAFPPATRQSTPWRATRISKMRDPLNAFCTHSAARLKGSPEGPLKGLTFAAKDLFDIEGHVTGAGNPDWLDLHAPATRTAPAVQRLVDAGADMVGKTHTDELSRG